MAQLNFAANMPYFMEQGWSLSHGTLSFVGFNLEDSISFNQVNLLLGLAVATRQMTISLGLYSMNGSTLSLANSASRQVADASRGFKSFATSATQNLTPGTWYFGVLYSSSVSSNNTIYGRTGVVSPLNAVQAGFVAGRVTASTNALPVSYATSDLDITGSDALNIPFILLTS